MLSMSLSVPSVDAMLTRTAIAARRTTVVIHPLIARSAVIALATSLAKGATNASHRNPRPQV